MLTAERLREVLDYDKDTGAFRWRVTLSNRAMAGREAGTIGKNGYRYISVDGHRCLAHRIAWLYMTGEHPPSMIDHIDTNSLNNRWENIRAADHRINAENKRKPLPGNKVGLLGVSPCRRGRFLAQIVVSGKTKWLGEFDTPEEAHSVYIQAKRNLHFGCTL